MHLWFMSLFPQVILVAGMANQLGLRDQDVKAIIAGAFIDDGDAGTSS